MEGPATTSGEGGEGGRGSSVELSMSGGALGSAGSSLVKGESSSSGEGLESCLE